jgi:hypothetical protein
MSEFPAREDFASNLNTKFRVYFNTEQPTEVELTEVTELREKPRYESFAIVFLAPENIPLEQMIYKVEHDKLGSMELFLVPFEKTEKGVGFEALFNYKRVTETGD